MGTTPLDAVDRRIVAELEADARLSGRALAERVQISRANAYARLERLVTDGVITGFHARVDPVRAGLLTSAYVTMTVRQNSWRDLQDRLRAIPEVRHMALLGGEFDVMLLVRATDNDALRRVVLERLQAIPGVLATRTFLIFEDVDNVPRRDPDAPSS
ncbi:Lrp/AsnC family transcriptional regulator [Pseudonocardia sp. HH130630-07]|uniref:Lrp/AsnC family transcriptional regulator n=1 Tax=Pseudonocardia sp. HH130630-07 TaxID=1690815 RepID=UPI0008151F93|nr:Lrp/AsnC family transcriptional regulator [Pseudonocardia sp. HH130630-07]ANY08468.1 transcriptional regulator [Pseudonocardia sp. HH130630-07]